MAKEVAALISMCTKMVSNNSWPPWVAYIITTFDLAFDLKVKFKVKGRGNDIVPTLRQHAYQMSQMIASLRSLHILTFFDLAIDLQGQI